MVEDIRGMVGGAERGPGSGVICRGIFDNPEFIFAYRISVGKQTMDKLFLSSRQAVLTNPAIIAVNRQGRLTADQKMILEKALDFRRNNDYLGVFMLMLFGLVVFSIVLGIMSGEQPGVFTQLMLFVSVFGMGLVFLLMAVMWFFIWRNRQEKYREIREGRVISEEGTVSWGAGEIFSMKSYVARTSQFKLLAPSYTLQLPPGQYRLYFLPKTRFLLSAEPLTEARSLLPESTSNSEKQALIGVLAKAHNFTLEELEANRRGQLSIRQRGRSFLSGSVYGGGGLLFLALCLNTFFMADENVIGGLIAGGVGLILLFFGGRILLDALNRHPVRSVEGQLNISTRRAGRSANVYYVVKGKELELPTSMVMRQAANSVIEGQKYRVFYLARASRVISLEPLE